jgi:hypothetical protein
MLGMLLYVIKPQFKVKFNQKRVAKRFKVTSVLYKTIDNPEDRDWKRQLIKLE